MLIEYVFRFVLATKLESPYSPPDSDGTPLGSPENQCYTIRESAVQSSDLVKNGESPKSNEHGCSATLSKQSANSPDRSVLFALKMSSPADVKLLCLAFYLVSQCSM